MTRNSLLRALEGKHHDAKPKYSRKGRAGAIALRAVADEDPDAPFNNADTPFRGEPLMQQVNGPDGNEQERRRLKQRVVELEAIVERQRSEIRDLHHVAHQFKYPIDAKLLRYIADEIDCEGCENLSVEWDTNASHCSKEDGGECGIANAWALREFARAVEVSVEALSLPERKEGDSIQAPSRAQSANASAVNQAFPIETAPMDGTHFIGIDGKNGWWREMWWKVDYYDGAYWMDECDSEPDPSHWIPLPIFDSSLNAELPTGQTESALEANTTSPPAQAAADAMHAELLKQVGELMSTDPEAGKIAHLAKLAANYEESRWQI